MSIRLCNIGSILALVTVSCLTTTAALAGIVNGNFEAGLGNGWLTTGTATREVDGADNHFARVSSNQNPAGFSTLRQNFQCTIDSDGEMCRIDFDVLGGQLLADGRANVLIYPNPFDHGAAIGLTLHNPFLVTKPIIANHYSFIVGPCGDNFTIEIYVTQGTTSWIDVDNFTSTCVPAPATCAVLLSGLASVGLRRRRN